MALLLPVESSFGFRAEDAYCRIESLSWSKRGSLTFSATTYLNQEASVSATALLTQTFSCDYSLEGDNPIAQAYQFLKTLPEFADATDC
jgi:hypothetical protein